MTLEPSRKSLGARLLASKHVEVGVVLVFMVLVVAALLMYGAWALYVYQHMAPK